MKRERDWEVEDVVDGDDRGAELQVVRKKSNSNAESLKCPYLDTINRHLLDFDSEKLCSQTLSNRNVYVCLVCGKFFEGRGKATPAYIHSVDQNHYVFMNLDSGRAYCLPDSYEILDNSLSDIRKCLAPEFDRRALASLSSNTELARDVHGFTYLPGCVGLNNLTATDDLNVVLHLLSHIAPLRDFFLQHDLYRMSDSKLLQEFGLVVRKLWSSENFKCTVSPQELVQRISVESKRRFAIGTRCEALELFVWLLATMNKQLEASQPSTKTKNHKAGCDSVLYEPIQGIVEVTTRTKQLVDNFEEARLRQQYGDAASTRLKNGGNAVADADGWIETTVEVPFNFLSLDIPPCPLFRDSHGAYIIPQIPLFQLLQKFDGSTWTDTVTKDAHLRKRYRIKQLPQYLVLHLARFTKNNFTIEKNPTIVTLPVRNLEMRDYVTENNSDGSTSASVVLPIFSAEDEALLSQCATAFQQAHPQQHVPEAVHALSSARLQQVIQRLGAPLHHKECHWSLSQAALRSQSHHHHHHNGVHNSVQVNEAEHDAQLLSELRDIAWRSLLRAQLLRSTKYDLVSSVCHTSDGSAKGIDVGDLSMSAASLSAKKKASSAALAAATAAASAAANMMGNNTTGAANANAGNNGSSGNVGNAVGNNNSDVVQRGSYKVHVSLPATGQWFELQDLNVTEMSAQQIGVSESYLLVYEKKLPLASSVHTAEA